MAQNSKIEWCDHTLNLWWGCTEVHEGCDNCYARVLSHRWGENLWGNDVKRRRIVSAWKDLAKYQTMAKAASIKDTVFVGSMMDIAEKSMPLSNPERHYTETDDLRQELFSRIIAGLYPNLIFLFLTKRPSNIPKYFPAGWLDEPDPQIWFGTSPVDQKTADTLIPQLLKIKANKFLSIEPQLGYVDLTSIKGNAGSVYQVLQPIIGCGDSDRSAIGWIIQGGESGHHKRSFSLGWARLMRDQCKEVGIPYFFKQIDKIQPIPPDLQVRQFPQY